MKERAEKMKVTDEIIYVGVNNHDIDLFEGQYIVPNGMAYNSYVILDEKIAVGRSETGVSDHPAYGTGSFSQY